MALSDDPYRVLGVDSRATADDVRQAYFRLVRRYPPEAHPDKFKAVRAAYETLRSPLRRAELSLLAFDETVGDIDLDLVANAAQDEVDFAAVWLAVELSASDLARTEFAQDMLPIREIDLLGA
jgi:curved DNA-binding protein CbpA